MKNIEQQAISTIRVLSVEAIDKANSGHPGIALGAASIIHTLYSRIMKIHPKKSNWINRDRFVLSAGHGSALLYSMLHLSGYDVKTKDLQEFRQLHSRTPGHPESGLTPGVDATTGPLGQGIASAVGMAIAEAHLNAKFPKLIDHNTYVLCGDGDLQEGISQEAISFAGNLGLSKLIVLYDSNDIQLDGEVQQTNTENTKEKFESMNWDYYFIRDGEDCDAIEKAIKKARSSDKPSLIEVKTIIGFGATNQGTAGVHGAPIKNTEVSVMRTMLGGEPFSVSDEVYKFYQEAIGEKGEKNYKSWSDTKILESTALFDEMVNDEVNIKYNEFPKYETSYNAATRVSSGEILDYISSVNPCYIGGSADLSCSTKIAGADGEFTAKNRLGRNLKFGVREHAMAAISNGIALHKGLRPFCSGFFVFSDYMKPAIRLSALMELPVIYVFTHDSVAVGEDGPTHQPIEQLTMLRSIPNLNVIRPTDANEVKEAYKIAIESKKTPTVIVLTRQNVPTLLNEDQTKVHLGAYPITDDEEFEGIIIASGSELKLALEVYEKLKENDIIVRVVNMPSINLFEQQSAKYQEQVLPHYITKRLAIEMSEGAHLHKYVGAFGRVYNINEFGHSGKGDEVIDYLGFNVRKVVKAYHDLPKIDVTRYL